MTKLFHTEATFLSPFGAITDLDDLAVDGMLAELEVFSPAIDLGTDRISFSLSVEAPDQVTALTRTLDATNAAGRQLTKWDLWNCVRAEVVDWVEFEKELERPTFPELVGITEIAEMAGITRQRASQLARSAQFPRPHADLASGPVWLKPNIEYFVEQWERKPGRPRTTDTLDILKKQWREEAGESVPFAWANGEGREEHIEALRRALRRQGITPDA